MVKCSNIFARGALTGVDMDHSETTARDTMSMDPMTQDKVNNSESDIQAKRRRAEETSGSTTTIDELLALLVRL